MRSLIRPRLLAVVPMLVVLGAVAAPSFGYDTRDLVTGDPDEAQPRTMEQFLTAVTTDVDAYWTKAFDDSGLPEPRVTLLVDPGGQTAASACGDDGGSNGRLRRRVLLGRRHDLHLAEVRDRHLRRRARSGAARQLAGLRADRGRLRGRLHRGPRVRPPDPGRARSVRALRAASSRRWRSSCRPTASPARGPHSAYEENRLEQGDVQEALDAALAVGDFDAGNPGHHGTPEQRADAWNSGFESGDPSSCDRYLDPAAST